MAVAKQFPDADGKGRGKKSELNAHFSRRYLQYARVVLQYTPETAAQVLAGTAPLIYRNAMMRP